MTQQKQSRQLTEFIAKDFARADLTLDEALKEFHAATQAYREWLESLPEAVMHTPPQAGKWSPAEHADHIIKGNQLIASMLNCCVQGQPMPEVPMGLQDEEGRLATEPLQPTPGRSKAELLTELATSHHRIALAAMELRAAGKQDVPCVATGLFAPLDTLEAVQLATSHYRHHMPQAAAAW